MSRAAPKVSLRNRLRRFRRSRRGSAAVEFALVAPVFFALLFAILETAIVFFAGQVLETITTNSARMVLTGQAQSGGFDQIAFKSYVCSQIPALFTCANIVVDVQSYSSFAGITFTGPINPSATFVPPNNYSPGGPSDIVVVHLYYNWPLFVTGLGYNIANQPGGTRVLIATAAFKNEPY